MARKNYLTHLKYHLGVPLGLILAFVVMVVSTQMVLADANSGGGPGATGGSCAETIGSATWNTCYGVSWRVHDADSDYIQTPGSTNSPGTEVINCKTLGGKYYLLAFERYKPQSKGTYLASFATGEHRGAVEVKKTTNGGGWYRFRDDISGTKSWADAEAAYALAVAAGLSNGRPWSDTAWFCWNDNLLNPEAGFTSTSSVKDASGNVTTSTPDSTANATATVTTDTYTVTFWHNIKYSPGNVTAPNGATLPTVSTDWNTTISGATSSSVPSNGTFTPTSAATEQTSSNLNENSVTVNTPENTDITICQTIKYNHKKVTFEVVNNVYSDPPTYAETGQSSACINIKRGTTTQPTVSASEGHFWASSMVEVSAQNDVPGYSSSWVTTKDGGAHKKVNIKLSTDASTLKVTFKHKMEYDNKLWLWSVQPAGTTNHAISSSDKFPDICSNYEINWSGAKTGEVKKNKLCTNKKGDNSGTEISKTTDETITLAKGETKKLCQTLKHDGKTVKLKRTDKDKTCGTWPNTYTCHDYWDYAEESRSGEGTTEICVEVTRPLDPDIPGDGKIPEDTKGPVSVDSERMYAGQTASIGWDARAKSVATRRLKRFEAISYLVNVGKSFDNTKASYTGNIAKNSVDTDDTGRYPNRGTKTPCQYYQDTNVSAGWTENDTWCEQGGSGYTFARDLNYGASEATHYTNNVHRTITVPDYVGYKYCNSFGYKWEYWYSISYDGTDSWQHEGSKDYWTNYDSVCRTIAKKPSSAIWNGGVMTKVGNGIKTSLAERFDNAGYAKPSEDYSRGAPQLYGSWVEHLATIGGGVNGFASGAALSRGNWIADIYDYSSMTISNTDASTLGSSGIDITTTLRDRLKTYLREQPASSRLEHTNTSSLAGLTVADSKTRIYASTGSFTISGDIKISDTYNSIYEIPQVLIFVDGDVTIAPGVQRVDAWIIATGKVETCAARPTDNTIATTANGYTGGTTTCDKQLVVNGPVIAGSTSLNRSYGADPIVYGTASERYTAAEIFNLSAEAYLWAYAQAGRYGSSYTEAYSRELAPRY